MIHKFLAGLEPEIFNDDAGTKDIDEQEQMYFLCRLLGVQKGSLLPTLTHEIDVCSDVILAALSQHYEATGGLTGPKTLANLRKGYYEHTENGKDIVCTLDTKDEKTKIVLGHADSVEIQLPLDVTTEIEVVTHGRSMKIDSIMEEFLQADIALPALEVEWKGALFGNKRPMKTPEKRKAAKDSPPAASGADPNAFASKSSVMLQDALRRKMQKKGPATGGAASGSSASGSKP